MNKAGVGWRGVAYFPIVMHETANFFFLSCDLQKASQFVQRGAHVVAPLSAIYDLL